VPDDPEDKPEEPTEPTEPKEPEDKPEEKDPPKVDPLPDLEHLTSKDLAKLRQEIRDEIAELHSSDKAEREELNRQLVELREYKEAQEKAQSERDKVEASSHTMVLPPSDIPPEQPNPNSSTKGEPDAKPRSRWKSIW
jgi:hypothetical protein